MRLVRHPALRDMSCLITIGWSHASHPHTMHLAIFPLSMCTLTSRTVKIADNGGAAQPARVARTGSFVVPVSNRSGAPESTVRPPFFLHHVNYPFTICLQRLERRSWSYICLIQ